MSNSSYIIKNFDWRKLVKLGENILDLKQLDQQQILIKQSIEDFLDCKVKIWFSKEPMPYSALKTLHFDFYNTIPSSLMMVAVKSGTPVVMNEAGEYTTPHKKKKVNNFQFPVTSIAAPIVSQDTFFGAIELTRTYKSGFNLNEYELFEAISAQITISMQASRHYGIDRRQLDLLSLVRKVSAQITELLDVDLLAKQVTSLILETFHYYYVAIFTIEPGLENLKFRYSASLERDYPPKFDVRIGEGIIGYTALHGHEVVANDVTSDPRYREIDVLPETKAEAAIPLKIENRILGVLDIQSDKFEAFHDTDMLILNSMADNIATALENARLFRDSQTRAAQLKFISETSNIFRSILDEDALLEEVVRLLKERLGYTIVNVYIHNRGRTPIYSPTNISAELDSGDESNLISWVAEHKQTKVIKYDSRSNAVDVRIRSEIAVPLIFGNNVLGVLNAQCDRLNAFEVNDIHILEALSDNIAVSLRNAYLYRTEQWRSKVAENMREVARLLTSNAGLDKVLQLILIKLGEALPMDASGIWLLDPNSDKLSSSLKLKAVNLSESYISSVNKEMLFTTDEIISYCNDSTIPSPWLQEALQLNEPLIRGMNSLYEPLGAILDFPDNYSAIAAPLAIDEKTIGLLTLTHQTPGRYGHEAQKMTATFASYAAVAIENTRLYETAHDQAWISTILLQIAEATQALDSLDELLDTMAITAASIDGISSCSIFIWEAGLGVYIPARSYGLSEQQEFYFSITKLSRKIKLDNIFEAKSPIQISIQDLHDYPPSFVSLFTSFVETDHKAFLFPMIAHNEILGVSLITLKQEAFEKPPKFNKENIGLEDKFTLIQGITHQTAVAAENIRLIKLQKEEAYVSVALLQVAQAIVSLNELDETIETIVRLTPILIGVKRCSIFLPDSQNQFRLVDSFGVSRGDVESISYKSVGEFPLIDLALSTNMLAYHHIGEETENPRNWASIQLDEIHLMKILENVESDSSIENILYSQNSILFAFPLSIKGKVLGVMVTQEMDFKSSANLIRSRERSYEISVGITQQTALAIQNYILQREVVDRERLEREFQLAREIQQTFLPEQMPPLKNWEVSALWRPAHIVSGDFFDLFKISEDNFVLVIADVADKGMPAALFMTLIRTLIRAAVREFSSPARILNRVNDLLVPDAKHGLFVTVACVVVNLKTGIIRYANAGHNPPLISRFRNNKIEDLPRTGMALGVIEGLVLTERELCLLPGDCLVMYTDGITESFSQNGEMYGEQRLKDTITSLNYSTTMEFTQGIEDSVSNFMNSRDYSDDLTLIVLKRQKSFRRKPIKKKPNSDGLFN